MNIGEVLVYFNVPLVISAIVFNYWYIKQENAKYKEYAEKILFSVFIVIAFFFSALTISEIFEDYLHDEKIKNVANKVLYLFAITIPLLTILGIYTLNI